MKAHLTEWSTTTMDMFPQFLTNCLVSIHLRHFVSSHTVLGSVCVCVCVCACCVHVCVCEHVHVCVCVRVPGGVHVPGVVRMWRVNQLHISLKYAYNKTTN